jgi:hypothetical protein
VKGSYRYIKYIIYKQPRSTGLSAWGEDPSTQKSIVLQNVTKDRV